MDNTCFGELCHPQCGGAYPPQTLYGCIEKSCSLGYVWRDGLAAVEEECAEIDTGIAPQGDEAEPKKEAEAEVESS